MEIYKDLIRKQIKEKYGTIDKFANAINVPRTTVNFVLKKGIEASNYGMINKIFKALNISHISDIPIVLDPSLLELINNYNQLDDIGKHTVKSVTETEFRRVTSKPIIANFGGVSSGKPFSEDEMLIMELVEKIKEQKNNNA
mgnify:CR=1 FL=1